MKIEVNYEPVGYGIKGWSLNINDERINNSPFSKEKLIKVISTIIEAIEERE